MLHPYRYARLTWKHRKLLQKKEAKKMAHSGYKSLHRAPSDTHGFLLKNKPQCSAQILFTWTLFLQLSEPKRTSKGKRKKFYPNIENNAQTWFKIIGAKWKACCSEGRNHQTWQEVKSPRRPSIKWCFKRQERKQRAARRPVHAVCTSTFVRTSHGIAQPPGSYPNHHYPN